METIPKPLVFFSGVLLILSVGWLDYITGQYVSLTLLYLLPIIGIAWFCGVSYALASAAVSGFTMLASDSLTYLGVHPMTSVINSTTRLTVFLMVTYGVSRIKQYIRLLTASAERERQTARIDLLTGLPNSRAFYEALTVEIKRAQRHNFTFSIGYIDIDGFKKINDELGHLAGDELLKTIAPRIRQSIRGHDTAARLGGDEFVILMPETTLDRARSVVERARIVPATNAGDDEPTATLSVGLASFRKTFPPVDRVISDTDNLMYMAKQRGKNSVVALDF